MKRVKRLSMLSLLLLAASLLTVSCKRDVSVLVDSATTVSRNLTGFEKIEITGSPTVYYTQSDSFSVKVTGPERLVSDIVTEVHDKTLFVRNKGKFGVFNVQFGQGVDFSVRVTSPDLIGIQLVGSGDFISKKRIDTDYMRVQLRGSGDIQISDLLCDHCITELTGSGDVTIDRLETEVSEVALVGSGDVDLKQWNVGQTDLSLKGSGEISVDFVEGCKRVDVKLQGSGDIDLKGKVDRFNAKKTGSGDIDTKRLIVP